MSNRRTTMGGPLSGSSAHNIDANNRRKSLAASAAASNAASIKKRQSMAPTSAASSASNGAASSRMSMGPSSSRASIGPGASQLRGSEARTSLGARNPAVDRKSGGGRRSSTGAGGRSTAPGIRSDPRPIADKNFVKEGIKTLITYLIAHFYQHQIAPKQLSSPSTKDFRNILLFLFQQLDRNFAFGTTDAQGNAVVFEEQVKAYMKRFGYPFNISKNALQAAGSPHTWPSLLAMLVWITEFLTYHERAYPSSNSPDGSGQNVVNESEKRMFFEYASGAYLAFLSGEDNFDAFDEALARKFELKNASVSEEIHKLTLRNDEASEAIGRYNASLVMLQDLIKFRDACAKDVPVLEENIKNNAAYKESVHATKVAREVELETRRGVLAQMEAERTELVAILAAQPFTALQVQEMNHQKAHLEAQINDQSSQQTQLQQEIWAREAEAARMAQTIEQAASKFNELSAELAEASERLASSANGSIVEFPHTELRVTLSSETASGMLNLDLKSHKESVQATKDSLLAAKKEVALEVKRQQPLLASLQESESERASSVDLLSKRTTKIHDLYAEERSKMNRQVEASCEAVEDVELAIVKLRNNLSSLAMEGVAAGQLAALEETYLRMESQYLQEQASLKADICSMMQELTEHKVAITERLEGILANAEEIRNKIKNTEV